MIKRLLALSLMITVIWPSHTGWAEEVPPPQGDSYYYLEVPPGGLKQFFRWHPLRIPLVSHHRGGPAPGFAENSIEAMQNALRYGPGLMEVDVAQLADGTLILMHDNTLDRTTTGKGQVGYATWADIEKLMLVDDVGKVTGHRVPRLMDALKWTTGRAILSLDIKSGTDFKAVAREVAEAGAGDHVVAITYSLDQALGFQAIAPEMMLTVTMRNADELAAVEASSLNPEMIIAWTGTRLSPREFYQTLHDRGWRVIVGTLGNPAYSLDGQIARSGNEAQYLDILSLGADIIATDRFWAVQQQLLNPNIFVLPAASSIDSGLMVWGGLMETQSSTSGLQAHKWPLLFLVLAALWAWMTLSGMLAAFDKAGVMAFRVDPEGADPIGPAWVEQAVRGLTHLGDTITLIVLAVLAIGWLLKRRDRSVAGYFAVMAGGSFLLSAILKAAFGRARPDIVDHLVHASSASFPSGHALRSAAVYLALLLLIRLYVPALRSAAAMAVTVLLFVSIGISRIYLGVHWPTDIVFAWLVAGFWVSLWSSRLLNATH